jgi:predicted alpha/beta-hydrolase family hydrolase
MTALLLTPGAGSDRDHSSLLALENGLAPLPVGRFDFPYRKAGRKFPDPAPQLIASLRDDAAAFAAESGVEPADLVLGGRSMGGRMCSMAVAEGLPAKGLVLICYPLHPPNKPEKRRVEHLPAIDVPCLFISGTRDAFGTPDELLAATDTIPGMVTHHWVDRRGHDLKGADDEIVEATRAWLADLD